MEKRTPHCKLAIVKKLVTEDRVRATSSAYADARALGVNNLSEMCAVVLDLESSDFYKSMTTYADHHVWQDVYRTQTAAGDVYLKLTVIDDVLIVSFKEF